MAKRNQLKRKSFFVDERVLHRVRRLLRASSDAETIRLSLERVVEMEHYWKYMAASRSSVATGSFDES